LFNPAALNSAGDIISLMLPDISGGAAPAGSTPPSIKQNPRVTHPNKPEQQIFMRIEIGN
jgi:hypothetical protein